LKRLHSQGEGSAPEEGELTCYQLTQVQKHSVLALNLLFRHPRISNFVLLHDFAIQFAVGLQTRYAAVFKAATSQRAYLLQGNLPSLVHLSRVLAQPLCRAGE